MVVDKGNGAWRAVAYGGSNYVKMLSSLRVSTAPTQPASQRTAAAGSGLDFVVEVLALGYSALGTLSPGTTQLQLASVTDYPLAQLKAGVTMPAQQVFLQLAPVARAFNGLPM